MSKILITGNGFDLFHHLPTKYHHFISIMTMIEDVEYNTDVSFEKLFGRVFKINHQKDYFLMIDNYNTNNIEFNLEKINRIKQFLETNLWYKYFKNISKLETWIDFEKEIETVLNQLTIFNKFEDKTIIKGNAFRDPLINFTDFQLFGIVSLIDKYGAFRINEKYINKRKSSIDVKEILNDLAKSFEDFIIIFNRYLVDIVSVFYPEIKQKSAIPFHLMNEIYTFNYTPTLENIYKIDKSKVIYLHGEINEECVKQNIVLGISDMPKEVKTSKMFDFTKYYQKVNKNSNKKFIEFSKSMGDIFNETVFYIIGHSLDESDKEYIVALFKFLKADKNKYSKICVFYYDIKDKENKWKNLFSIMDKDTILEMNKIGRLYFVELSVINLNREFNDDWSSTLMEPTVFS